MFQTSTQSVHIVSYSSVLNTVEASKINKKMKYNNIETTSSYNSIHPVYLCTDQLSEDFENYHEGTIWWGIFLAFISGAFFTISSALVKGIEDVDPMILLIIRSVLQIIVMLFIAHKERKNLIGPHGQRQLIQLQVGIFFSLSLF